MYRSRHPHRGGVVDVETARRAVAQVTEERDALARQLRRAQDQLGSLERQLEERQAQSRREVRPTREPAALEARIRRLEADLHNLRRHQAEAVERGVRERTDAHLLELVSVHDAVQRALDALPDRDGPWHTGLNAVLDRIDTALAREGLERVGRPGEPFDPRLHEGVGTAPGAPGTIVQTVSSGLVRGDGGVLVPARVVVGAA